MSEMNHDFGIELREYVAIIWKRKWFIIALCIVAVVSAYFIVNRMSPIYQTSSTILVQKNDGMQNLFAGEMFSIGKDLSSTYSRILKSRNLMVEVIKRVGLTTPDGSYFSANSLQSMFRINSIAGTDLIEISIQYADPTLASEIVNTLVNVFQEKNTEMNKSALSGARQFVERQLLEVKGTLEKAETDLLNFKQSNNVVIPSVEAQRALERLIQVESLRSMVVVDQKGINASIEGIQKELELQDNTVISSTVFSNNPLITQYKAQIVELESKLVGLKAKFTNSHPEVLSLEKQLETLNESLEREVVEYISTQTKSINPVYTSLYSDLVKLETTWLANQAKLQSYDSLIQEYEQGLQHLPEKELKLARLERVAKVTGEIYTMLMTRLEEFKISESMQTSNVYVVDKAYVPLYPIKPNKRMLILSAAFLAMFVGISMALLIDLLDTTVKTAEDVEALLGLPVLGTIPDIKRIKKIYPNHR